MDVRRLGKYSRDLWSSNHDDYWHHDQVLMIGRRKGHGKVASIPSPPQARMWIPCFFSPLKSLVRSHHATNARCLQSKNSMLLVPHHDGSIVISVARLGCFNKILVVGLPHPLLAKAEFSMIAYTTSMIVYAAILIL
jgi:hypothetical protein